MVKPTLPVSSLPPAAPSMSWQSRDAARAIAKYRPNMRPGQIFDQKDIFQAGAGSAVQPSTMADGLEPLFNDGWFTDTEKGLVLTEAGYEALHDLGLVT